MWFGFRETKPINKVVSLLYSVSEQMPWGNDHRMGIVLVRGEKGSKGDRVRLISFVSLL